MNDIAQLSYEQARDELITIVKQLESGDLALADSVALWKRGEALAAHCERWLQQTQHELAQAQAQPETGANDPNETAETQNNAGAQGHQE